MCFHYKITFMDKEEEDDSTSKNVHDDDAKSVTSQVLEYYQRYSQNRELPKYLCGASAIKPRDWQFVPDNTNIPIRIDICTDHTQPISTELERDIPRITVESVCAPSPTSSVTSNRKLEWDNGADIGYSHSNVQKSFQKSISLPTLINDLELDKLRTTFKNTCSKKETNDVSVNVNIKFSDLSSSDSTHSSRKGYILSTPSSGSNQEFLTDSEMCRSNHLKDSIVGLPIAESTPVVDGYCLTPRLKENDSEKLTGQIDLNMVDRISRYKNMKVLKLAVSNTVMVECAGATEPLRGKSKLVQTSPQSNPSIGIQTDFDYTDSHIIKPSAKSSEKQSVFYVCFTDSDKDTSATPCSTMHTQTNSMALSNCDSFEYHDGENYSQAVPVENKPKEDTGAENTVPDETKPLDEPIDYSPLSTLLRQKLGGNNIEELQRNIDLLQKLISSQKYDSITKKHYVKKIIQRIVSNKNSSSKSRSELSENSKPKKDYSLSELSKDKSEQDVPPSILSESSSDEKLKQDNSCSKSSENKIERDTPRSMLSETSTSHKAKEDDSHSGSVNDTASPKHSSRAPIKSASKKKLGVQSFSNEILSKEEPSTSSFVSVGAKKGRLRRSHLLTLTDGRDADHFDAKSEDKSDFSSVSQRKPVERSQGSSSSLKESEVGDKHRNWRDSKTNSEINLEQKIGDCDYPLINFAKKERDNQLYWINNEIVHLNKLKKVLENNKIEAVNAKLDKLTKKPRVEDMKGAKKQTTVYVLSTERDNYSKEIRSPIRSSQSSRKSSQGSPPQRSEYKPSSFVNEAVVEIGNEKINLHNAHLVASEEFTSNSEDRKCTTVVRRYTFELPSESDDRIRDKSPCSGDSHYDKRRNMYDSEASDGKVEKNYPRACGCCKCLKNDFSCKCCPNSPSQRKSCDKIRCSCCRPCSSSGSKNRPCCTCPKGPIIVKEKSIRKCPTRPICVKSGASCCSCSPAPSSKASNLTKQLVLTDEIAAKKCTCKKLTKNHIFAEQCVQCGQKPDLSCNLVMTDEISNTKSGNNCPKPDLCCTCSKPKIICTCSEPECYCCSCSQPKISCICIRQDESTSETSSACTCAPKLCSCCKQQKTLKPSGPCRYCKINANDKKDDPVYLLCYPCYQNHGSQVKPYLIKSHVCDCYDISDTMKKIEKTIKLLENLESETELCNCSNQKKSADSGDVCSKCNCKLKPRYRRRKGGLAYSITLEPDPNLPTSEKKELMESLQEIKIKIPSPRRSKDSNSSGQPTSSSSSTNKNICCCCSKDKSCSKCQCKLKSEDSKGTKESSDEDLEEIIIQIPKSPKKKKKSNDCKRKRAHKKPGSSVVVCTCACLPNFPELGSSKKVYDNGKGDAEESNYSSDISYKISSKKGTEKKLCDCRQPCDCKNDKTLSLQEYLRKNNPNFVSNADKRKELLTNWANKREKQNVKFRESLILSRNHQYNSHKNHEAMFSTKEMKRITAKNYKKGKEFQQKLLDLREREIKRSNKLLYDLFNKRLREQVLKGRPTLPLEASIFNLR